MKNDIFLDGFAQLKCNAKSSKTYIYLNLDFRLLHIPTTLVRLTVETRFALKVQIVTLTGGNNRFSCTLPSAKRRIESALKHGDDDEEAFRNRWK